MLILACCKIKKKNNRKFKKAINTKVLKAFYLMSCCNHSLQLLFLRDSCTYGIPKKESLSRYDLHPQKECKLHFRTLSMWIMLTLIRPCVQYNLVQDQMSIPLKEIFEHSECCNSSEHLVEEAVYEVDH